MADPLFEPSLSALYLYLVRPEIDEPLRATGLSLNEQLPRASERRIQGSLPGGEQLTVETCQAHDAHLLRLTLRPAAPQAAGWGDLKRTLDELLQRSGMLAGFPRPWAASLLYHAVAPEDFSEADLVPALTDPAGPALLAERFDQFETLPFGWFLCGTDIGPEGDAGWPQRTLILLTPQDRAERVQTYFLQPLNQGLARIELYLHKSRHHARQQILLGDQLGLARASLQESMQLALQTTDFSKLHQEQQELEAISNRLMQFQTQKAYAELLLTTLRTNVRALNEHLGRVRLRSGVYDQEVAALDRHIEQLENDLTKAQTVADSTLTFQDLQRSVEASRFERAGYLMGSTAALLAGIAIFNSFLDIWALSIEGTGLNLPPVGLRICLGLLAGVSWPMAALRIVERQRKSALIWMAIGVGTILAAALSTGLVN